MYNTESNRKTAAKVMDYDKKMILHENKKDHARMSNIRTTPNDVLQEGGTMGRKAAKNFWEGAGSDYSMVMKDNIQGGGLSAGVKQYRKKNTKAENTGESLQASNVSKGTMDRRLGEGEMKAFTCSCKDSPETKNKRGTRARKLVPVNDMPAASHGGSSSKKSNPRSILVKKIMAEKGMSMIEASSFIKQNNLY
jgi:hypothetical protein